MKWEWGQLTCPFAALVALSAVAAFGATTGSISLDRSERALVQLCNQATKEQLNANRPLVQQILGVFEGHMALCAATGRRVGWNAVEAFREAAKRYRDADLHHTDLLVRWYDLILAARPNHRDALEIEYDAAHQFDLDCLHWTDDKASPTEAIRRFRAIVAKYPLTLRVYQAHARIANAAEFTNQIDLAKKHLEFMIAVRFEDLRGPRPMSRAQWKERLGGDVPDSMLDTMETLERMQSDFEGERHAARRMLVFWCIQNRANTLEEMQAEFDRLRAKFPGDKPLAGVMDHALKEGPKGRGARRPTR